MLNSTHLAARGILLGCFAAASARSDCALPRAPRVCSARSLTAAAAPQLDVYLQLYRGMVQQVNIFKACPDDFHRAVVMKLQNSICTA